MKKEKKSLEQIKKEKQIRTKAYSKAYYWKNRNKCLVKAKKYRQKNAEYYRKKVSSIRREQAALLRKKNEALKLIDEILKSENKKKQKDEN